MGCDQCQLPPRPSSLQFGPDFSKASRARRGTIVRPPASRSAPPTQSRGFFHPLAPGPRPLFLCHCPAPPRRHTIAPKRQPHDRVGNLDAGRDLAGPGRGLRGPGRGRAGTLSPRARSKRDRADRPPTVPGGPAPAARRPPPIPSTRPRPTPCNDAWLHNVCFADAVCGWAVGDRGTIWHTGDGGRHWQLQDSGVACTLWSVSFLDAATGWAAGGFSHPYLHTSSGVVLATRDGGRHWYRDRGLLLPALKRIGFFDAKHGWAAGNSSPLFPSGVFSSRDGGRSWMPACGGSAAGWTSGDFFDPHTGILAGRNAATATIRQGDLEAGRAAGLDLQTLPATAFARPTYAWLVGDGGACGVRPGRSLAGAVAGLSPRPGRNDRLRGLGRPRPAVPDGRLPGSRVLHSPDGGRNWSVFPTPTRLPLSAMTFVDDRRGWAVGAMGTILASADGGQTWQSQHSGAPAPPCWDSSPRTKTCRWNCWPGSRATKATWPSSRCWAAATSTPPRPTRPRRTIASTRRWLPWAARRPDRLAIPVAAEGPASARDGGVGRLGPLPRRAGPAGPPGPARVADPPLAARGHRHQRRRRRPYQRWRRRRGRAIDRPGGGRRHRQGGRSAGLRRENHAGRPEAVASETGLRRAAFRGAARRTDDGPVGAAARPSLADVPGPSSLIEDRAGAADAALGFRPLAAAAAAGPKRRRFLRRPGPLPGGQARRQGPPALGRRRAAPSAAGPAPPYAGHPRPGGRDPQAAARLLAQTDDLTRGLDAASAAAILYRLADRYATSGRGDMAAEAFQLLVDHYPDDPLSRPAVWLLQYYASGEEAQRARAASTWPRRGSPTDRLERAVALATGIERNHPDLFAHPAVRFPAAAAYRKQGQVQQAESCLCGPGPRRGTDAWSACARGETWLVQPKGAPPKPTFICVTAAAKPRLDGLLDDAVWRGPSRPPCGAACTTTRNGRPPSCWPTTTSSSTSPSAAGRPRARRRSAGGRASATPIYRPTTASTCSSTWTAISPPATA